MARRIRRLAAIAAALAVSMAGWTAASGTTTTQAQRPKGPAADLSEELTGGDGVFIGTAYPDSLDKSYVEREFVAAGTATSYTSATELTSDGRWSLEPGDSAAYRTRVLVRRPKKPADFSGTVIVEWLNVSGGVDADPDFVNLSEEIVRQGHIWVGVSAQLIGVEGGPVAVRVETPSAQGVIGKGLKAIDPARYGSLQHPGDAFSFDIFTQVARALRRGGPLLGNQKPKHVVAAGQSQSAFAMVTYINGVQPLTHAFDGFFVHSRGGAGFPIAAAGAGGADIAGSLGGVPTILRTDTDVPILDIQTEGDLTSVLSSFSARQPDTKSFRLWEVAGTSHADAFIVGPNVSTFDCGVPINDGPMHVVAKAALRHFVRWVETGKAPPKAPRLEVEPGEPPTIARDADGIALGGVRTPPVDVPVRVLSSVQGPVQSVICLLLGSTQPLPADRLAQLYPSRNSYERRFAAATKRAVAAGFVLADDRDALEGYAHPELVAG